MQLTLFWPISWRSILILSFLVYLGFLNSLIPSILCTRTLYFLKGIINVTSYYWRQRNFQTFLGVQRPPVHSVLLEKPSCSFRSSTHLYRDFNTHPSCLVVIDDNNNNNDDDDDDDDDNAVVWTMDHSMYKLSTCYYRIWGEGELRRVWLLFFQCFPVLYTK